MNIEGTNITLDSEEHIFEDIVDNSADEQEDMAVNEEEEIEPRKEEEEEVEITRGTTKECSRSRAGNS